MEMATHDGVDAVRADKHVAAHSLAAQPELGVSEMRNDAALVLEAQTAGLMRVFRLAVESLDEFARSHSPVLVHCHAGRSR